MKIRSKAMVSLILAGTTCIGMLGGCSSSDDFAANNQEMTAVAYGTLQAEQIADALLQTVAPDANMIRLEESSVPSYYSFDEGLASHSCVYISTNSNRADEVAVFELAEGKDASPVVAAVNERVQRKERAYRKISPAEYEKLRTAIQLNISGYVVLAVTSNSDVARGVIADLFYNPESAMDSTDP